LSSIAPYLNPESVIIFTEATNFEFDRSQRKKIMFAWNYHALSGAEVRALGAGKTIDKYFDYQHHRFQNPRNVTLDGEFVGCSSPISLLSRSRIN
jgi:hypothetical protein